MAEIQSQQPQKKAGGRRCKKIPVRVDLTPMVDLGFLLITFFVFTTSLSRPNGIKLVLPSGQQPPQIPTVTGNKVLTLVLADENRLGYYFGDNAAGMLLTSYGAPGIRRVILNKQADVAQQYGDAQQLLVLIKPSGASTYKNVVETLDEMLINNVSRYMLLDPSLAEQQLLIKKMPAKQL